MDPDKNVASIITAQKTSVETTSKPTPPPKRVKQEGEESKEFNKEVIEIHRVLQENLKIDNFKLNFSIDRETRTVVVRVIDGETGEVIREIPPSEILAIAEEMEKLKGILFNGNM
jgi:flagellar protein FlaG